MLNLIRIAITGGIASGKTSVCRVFQELGAFVVNADAIVHELLSPKTDLGQQVIRLLGNVLENGKLSRRMIADKVFKDPESLHALEQLLHPAVLQKIEELYQTACRQNKYSLFVVESPLLFEIGQDPFYDIIITVAAEDSTARQRFQAEGFSDEEYVRRMKRQLPPDQKAKRADYVIHNDGSLEHLRKTVIELNQRIQNQKKL